MRSNRLGSMLDWFNSRRLKALQKRWAPTQRTFIYA